MSFAHGAASKGVHQSKTGINIRKLTRHHCWTGLLIWTGFASFVARYGPLSAARLAQLQQVSKADDATGSPKHSTFGKKHYFHLQLVPHITRDHQLWRLISRNLAFTSSIDLFVSILILFNTSSQLERRFGTAKFVSFALVASFIGTALEVVALAVFNKLGLEYLPAGPYSFIFALIYNYDRAVPSSYIYKIFGVSFSSKSLLYLLSLQLVFSQPPNSIVSAACGIAAGILYKNNFLGSRRWRVPALLQKGCKKILGPLLETDRIPRRSTRTALDDIELPSQPSPASTTPRAAGTARQGAISEVVQTFAGTRSASAPSAEAVAQLQAMFPQSSVEQINSALQRAGNDVNRSVEYLLTG